MINIITLKNIFCVAFNTFYIQFNYFIFIFLYSIISVVIFYYINIDVSYKFYPNQKKKENKSIKEFLITFLVHTDIYYFLLHNISSKIYSVTLHAISI